MLTVYQKQTGKKKLPSIKLTYASCGNGWVRIACLSLHWIKSKQRKLRAWNTHGCPAQVCSESLCSPRHVCLSPKCEQRDAVGKHEKTSQQVKWVVPGVTEALKSIQTLIIRHPTQCTKQKRQCIAPFCNQIITETCKEEKRKMEGSPALQEFFAWWAFVHRFFPCVKCHLNSFKETIYGIYHIRCIYMYLYVHEIHNTYTTCICIIIPYGCMIYAIHTYTIWCIYSTCMVYVHPVYPHCVYILYTTYMVFIYFLPLLYLFIYNLNSLNTYIIASKNRTLHMLSTCIPYMKHKATFFRCHVVRTQAI